MLFVSEKHQGPFCANCQYFRAHYYCHLGSFLPCITATASAPTKPQTERIQRLSPVGTIRRSVQPTSRPLSSPFQLPLFPNQCLTFPIGSANVWDNSTDEDKSGFLTCGTENAGQRLEACHRTPVKPPPSWASN